MIKWKCYFGDKPSSEVQLILSLYTGLLDSLYYLICSLNTWRAPDWATLPLWFLTLT